MSTMVTGYAELHAHSCFSLLEGASSPEALVEQAQALGMEALALTDRDGLSGAVRFWTAARKAGIRPVIGAEVTMEDDSHLTLLAENQTGYANLCRLLTKAHLRDIPENVEEWPGKGEPRMDWAWLMERNDGLLALSGCRRGSVSAALLRGDETQAEQAAKRLLDTFGRGQVWIELQHHLLPDDDHLVRELIALARRMGVPCVATNDAHYATPDEARLHDAFIAIRHNESLTEARQAGRLPLNHTYHLASAREMERRFAEHTDALRQTLAIAGRCEVSLDFSGQRLPAFPVPPDSDAYEQLYHLCQEGLKERYPRLRPRTVNQLTHELSVIEGAGLAGFFLIVHDIVRFARNNNIRCQGRGSAASSLVAYLLGITPVDPIEHNLLFERFLSADRRTMPDIDIDFAADRREEVIQYVYEKYGQAHVAMVCNTVTFRARSAVRDLGKALGFPLSVVDQLAKSLDTHSPSQAADLLIEQMGENDAPHHPIRLLADLLRQIDGCPRHLSIHVGGMLITGAPLDQVVPLERATMPGRVVCQWDKDSVEDAGLIKLDLLGLRTLGLVTEALTHIEALEGEAPDLDALTLDDPHIYHMLQQADTVGTFQVESRAQQQILPRLKPTCFEDIIISISIVRPGPIQADMVHPYLRRRAGTEPVTYPHPALEPILAETLGVLLYQEQELRVVMDVFGFSPGDANALRKTRFRHHPEETMVEVEREYIQRALTSGLNQVQAEETFKMLAVFKGFGFCKSHAASFALVAYQTLWLKHYQPTPFYCALLNQQPMGFYSPEVIIGDARRHGVELLPPEINRSDWKYTIERTPTGKILLRTGLRAVLGLGKEGWERVDAARQERDFSNLRDFCRRTRLPNDAVTNLIRAGALDAFGERRPLLWQLGELDYRPQELSLTLPSIPAELPTLEALEQMQWDYELMGLSPDGQMLSHYRDGLKQAGVLTLQEVKRQPNGARVRIGGMKVIRQRPPTAKGVVFISLEDETGLLDLIVWPDVYERYRTMLRSNRLILVEGTVQQEDSAVSVLLTQAVPITDCIPSAAT